MPLLPNPITTVEELQRQIDIAILAYEIARGEYRERPECCGKPMTRAMSGNGSNWWECKAGKHRRGCGARLRNIGGIDQPKIIHPRKISEEIERPICCGNRMWKNGTGKYLYWFCGSCKKHTPRAISESIDE